MKYEFKRSLSKLGQFRRQGCVLFLVWSTMIVLMPRASAYTPIVAHTAVEHETSIDGELYDDGEVMTCRTPVRYYYYKVLEESGDAYKSLCRENAEAWAKKTLPDVDTIKGLVKKIEASCISVGA